VHPEEPSAIICTKVRAENDVRKRPSRPKISNLLRVPPGTARPPKKIVSGSNLFCPWGSPSKIPVRSHAGRRREPPLITPGVAHPTTPVAVRRVGGWTYASSPSLQRKVKRRVNVWYVKVQHRRERRAPGRRVGNHDYGICDSDLGMVQSPILPLHLEGELASQSSLEEADEAGGVIRNQVWRKFRCACRLHDQESSRPPRKVCSRNQSSLLLSIR